MDQQQPKLTVNYTRLARINLAEIWNWNAERYGVKHADTYVAFLEDEAEKLEYTYDKGKPVAFRPNYRYIAIRRTARGYGHLAIYLVTESSIEILAFLHERQDWIGKIERGDI